MVLNNIDDAIETSNMVQLKENLKDAEALGVKTAQARLLCMCVFEYMPSCGRLQWWPHLMIVFESNVSHWSHHAAASMAQ